MDKDQLFICNYISILKRRLKRTKEVKRNESNISHKRKKKIKINSIKEPGTWVKPLLGTDIKGLTVWFDVMLSCNILHLNTTISLSSLLKSLT